MDAQSSKRAKKQWEFVKDLKRLNKNTLGCSDCDECLDAMTKFAVATSKYAERFISKKKLQKCRILMEQLELFILRMYLKHKEHVLNDVRYLDYMAGLLSYLIDLRLAISSNQENCVKSHMWLKLLLENSKVHIIDSLLQMKYPTAEFVKFTSPLLKLLCDDEALNSNPELYIRIMILVRQWIRKGEDTMKKELKRQWMELTFPKGVRKVLRKIGCRDFVNLLDKQTKKITTAIFLKCLKVQACGSLLDALSKYIDLNEKAVTSATKTADVTPNLSEEASWVIDKEPGDNMDEELGNQIAAMEDYDLSEDEKYAKIEESECESEADSAQSDNEDKRELDEKVTRKINEIPGQNSPVAKATRASNKNEANESLQSKPIASNRVSSLRDYALGQDEQEDQREENCMENKVEFGDRNATVSDTNKLSKLTLDAKVSEDTGQNEKTRKSSSEAGKSKSDEYEAESESDENQEEDASESESDEEENDEQGSSGEIIDCSLSMLEVDTSIEENEREKSSEDDGSVNSESEVEEIARPALRNANANAIYEAGPSIEVGKKINKSDVQHRLEEAEGASDAESVASKLKGNVKERGQLNGANQRSPGKSSPRKRKLSSSPKPHEEINFPSPVKRSRTGTPPSQPRTLRSRKMATEVQAPIQNSPPCGQKSAEAREENSKKSLCLSEPLTRNAGRLDSSRKSGTTIQQNAKTVNRRREVMNESGSPSCSNPTPTNYHHHASQPKCQSEKRTLRIVLTKNKSEIFKNTFTTGKNKEIVIYKPGDWKLTDILSTVRTVLNNSPPIKIADSETEKSSVKILDSTEDALSQLSNLANCDEGGMSSSESIEF